MSAKSDTRRPLMILVQIRQAYICRMQRHLEFLAVFYRVVPTQPNARVVSRTEVTGYDADVPCIDHFAFPPCTI